MSGFVIRRSAGVNTLAFGGNTYDLNALDKATRRIVLTAFRNHVNRSLPQ